MKMRSSEKKVLSWIFYIAYTSGVTLYIFSRFIRVQTPIGEQHHDAEHWVRVVHSLLTYGLMLGLGFVIKSHVIPGLRAKSRDGVKTGISLLAIFGIMLVTALGILYFSDSDWQTRASQIHAYLGLSIPVLIGIHLWKRKSTSSDISK